jgi:hypothetical protein
VKIGNVFCARNDFLQKKTAEMETGKWKMGFGRNDSASNTKKMGRDLSSRPILHSPFSILDVREGNQTL